MQYVRTFKLVMEKEATYRVENKKCKRTTEVAAILNECLKLNAQPQEVFAVMTLDTKKNVTGIFEISRGTQDKAIVEPRDVFSRAVMQNAHTIIVAHNHPSGDTTPSRQDIDVTKRLKDAGEILGIEVIDSVIIAGDKYYSFLEKGIL